MPDISNEELLDFLKKKKPWYEVWKGYIGLTITSIGAIIFFTSWFTAMRADVHQVEGDIHNIELILWENVEASHDYLDNPWKVYNTRSVDKAKKISSIEKPDEQFNCVAKITPSVYED